MTIVHEGHPVARAQRPATARGQSAPAAPLPTVAGNRLLDDCTWSRHQRCWRRHPDGEVL